MDWTSAFKGCGIFQRMGVQLRIGTIPFELEIYLMITAY